MTQISKKLIATSIKQGTMDRPDGVNSLSVDLRLLLFHLVRSSKPFILIFLLLLVLKLMV
jgi:hypothetical protein